MHGNRKTNARVIGVVGFLLFVFVSGCAYSQLLPALLAQSTSAPASASSQATTTSSQQSQAKSTPELPLGKKLILKDGSFQMIREYQVTGDRVRYYSIDAGDWEEMPAALVDWDATKKDAQQEHERYNSLVSAEKKREEERVIPELDVDASIEAAPGVFLPDGEGLFAYDGQSIIRLKPTDMTSKLDKKKSVEKVLVPIPIIPTRHNIELEGTRAKLRIKSSEPEFYVRTAPDGTAPPIELVRAKIHKDARQLERVDQSIEQEQAVGDTVSMQRWPVAPGVYRFTLSQPLEPGEYALVQIERTETMSFDIWDFGVDPGAIHMPKLK